MLGKWEGLTWKSTLCRKREQTCPSNVLLYNLDRFDDRGFETPGINSQLVFTLIIISYNVSTFKVIPWFCIVQPYCAWFLASLACAQAHAPLIKWRIFIDAKLNLLRNGYFLLTIFAENFWQFHKIVEKEPLQVEQLTLKLNLFWSVKYSQRHSNTFFQWSVWINHRLTPDSVLY